MPFSSSPFTSPPRPVRDGANVVSASHGTQDDPISFDDDDDDLVTDSSLSPSPYFTQPTQVVKRSTLGGAKIDSKTGTQPTQITNRPIVGLGPAHTETSPSSRSDASIKSIKSSSPNKIEVPRSSPFKSSPPYQRPVQPQRQRILGGMNALAPAGTAFQRPTFLNQSTTSRVANESPPVKRKMSASSDELSSSLKFPIRPDSSSPERTMQGDIKRSSFQPRQGGAPITMAMKLTREFEEKYDAGTQLKAKKLSRRFSDKSNHLLHYARAIKLKNGDMDAAYDYMVKTRSSAIAPPSSPVPEPKRSRLVSKGHLTSATASSSRPSTSRSPSPAPAKRRRLIRKGNLDGASVVPLISLVDSTDDEKHSVSNDKSDGDNYDSESESEAEATDTENITKSRVTNTTDIPKVGAKRMTKILQYLESCTVEDLAANAKISKDDAKYLLTKRPFHTITQLKAVHKFKTTSRKKVKVDLGEDVFDSLNQHVKRLDAIDRIIQMCDAEGIAINTRMDSWKMDKLGEMKTTAATARSIVLPFPKEPELVESNLYAYQLFGMNWMWELYSRRVGGILADDMGLGKTCQTIAFMALLVKTHKIGLLNIKPGPNLVVVPPSVLDNWQNEFVKFAPGLSVIKYSGSPLDRDELAREILDAAGEYDVILTSYTQMSRSRDTSWMNKIGINAAVFDEGHQLKNSQTLKYKELIRINANWKLLITGTPIQNNIMEMMSLLSFVSPQFFTRDQEIIEQLFSQKASLKEVSEGATLLSDRIQRARSILEPFILQRKKDQVLSMLPPKIRKVVYCDMLPRQKAQYDVTSADSRQAFLGGRVETGGRKNDRNNPWVQLRKAATHPMLFRTFFDDDKCEEMAKILMDVVGPEELQQPSLKHMIAELKDLSDFKLHLWCRDYKCLKKFDCDEAAKFESGKVQKLLEMVREYQENGDRVLVFSRFEAVLDILEECLHQEGIKYRLIEGRTPVLDRQMYVDEFQEDKSIPVFLLTTVAGGMGINLTGANKIIIFDQSDNPQQDVQAENRAHRLGQEKEVEVVRFITQGTIDELIYKACQKKLELAGHITGFNEDIGDEKDSGLVAEVTKQLLKGEGGGSGEGYITPPKSDI